MNVMDCEAIALADSVRRRIKGITGNAATVDAGVQELRSLFSTNPKSYKVDYERLAPAFAAGFFEKNYLHATNLFLTVQDDLPTTVLDWGGGSGATTLAYLTALQLRTPGSGRCRLSLDLFDESDAQLTIASEILADLPTLFPNLDVKLSLRAASLSDWKPKSQSYSAILFGYVLTENEEHIPEILGCSLDALLPGGNLFILEDSAYPVWSEINSSLNHLAVPRYAVSTRFTDHVGFKTPGDHTLQSTCLVVKSLRSEPGRNLVGLYFQAWEERRVDLLDQVFTDDASYVDNSIPRSLHGIENIRGYWFEHVVPQTEFSIQIARVFEYGPDIVCEWSARFASPVHGGRVRFDGTIIFTIDADLLKISRLVEYVNKLPL